MGFWWYFDGASFMAGLEGNAVTVAIQADVRASGTDLFLHMEPLHIF